MVSISAMHTIKTAMFAALISAWSFTLHAYVLPMMGLTHDDHPAFFYGVVAEVLSGTVLIVLLIDYMSNPPKELAEARAKQREEMRIADIAERDRRTLRRAVENGRAPPEILTAGRQRR